MSSANVSSLQILTDLKTQLARFASESQAALQRLDNESRRTYELLVERKRRCEFEVRRCQEMVKRADDDLAYCCGSRPPRDCSVYEEFLRRAQHRLREAEAELANIVRWIRTLEEAITSFQRQARRMTAFTEKELVEAQTFLMRKVSMLETYLAIAIPSAGAITTTAPTQVLADTFTAGVVLGTLGVTGAAVSVVRQMAGSIQHALGDTGEVLTTRLLNEQPGWQEIVFNQPKHGFDRLFSTPGLPIIVVESKVDRRGKLHLGQTKSGEQGSSEWIAATAVKMADPNSAQWSPVNAQIGALIQEIGPEKIPVVAVVVETETGNVGIYYKENSGADWQQLQDDTRLDEVLGKNSQENQAEAITIPPLLFQDAKGNSLALSVFPNRDNWMIRIYDQATFPDPPEQVRGGDVGRANLQLERNAAGDVERIRLQDIETRPSYQGSGIGSRMLDQVEAIAQQYGATEIYGSAPDEHTVRDWYTKRGYEFRKDGLELFKQIKSS